MQCRIEDVGVGDVINRDPDGLRGWFLVAHISTLFNGEIQLSDESQNESISGGQFDVIGLQFIEEFGLDDDTGFVSPPEPTYVPAPAQPVPTSIEPLAAVVQESAPVVVEEPVPAAVASEPTPEPVPVQPDPVPVAPVSVAAAPEPTPEPAAAPVPDPEPEPVVADPVGLNFRSGPEIDLGKIAAALDGLDVGPDTYALTFQPSDTPLTQTSPTTETSQTSAAVEPNVDPPPSPEQTEPAAPEPGARRSTDPSSVTWARRSPDLPPVPMPEGAVPVYGDTLPESPSYLNPVVVREPGAAALPKRRSRGG